MNIFSIDSPFMRFLGKVADIMILNILYIVCSLPIITIGTSTCAAFNVTKKLIKGDETFIIKDFFFGFKKTFKSSTLSWLIMIFIGFVLIVDFKIAYNLPSTFKNILHIIIAMLGVIYLFTLTYLFQYISNFQNKLFSCFRNSLLLSIAKLPYTLLFLFFNFLCIFITYVLGLGITGSFWTLFGFAFIIYVNTFIYLKIFNSINIQTTNKDYKNENS